MRLKIKINPWAIVAPAAGIFIGGLLALIAISSSAAYVGSQHHAQSFAVSDKDAPVEQPYDFGQNDLQYPEHPTGCEAVSAAVLLRLNGSEITNEDFIAALPRTDGKDFVNAFWGDPDATSGWACMAPCITTTMRPFVTNEKTVLDITGTPLVNLPTPCVIWVTMDYEEPSPSEYEQDGYRLFYNTHCVVLLSCDDHQAHIWDPASGKVDIAFTTIDNLYNELGRQAVYIAPRTQEG